MSTTDRAYPDRPFLAVSAAIIRDGRVLIVRRAGPPAKGIFTLPGGVVEAGETLEDAITREVREETSLEIVPVALSGHREVVRRDADGRVAAHFVILAFAARWVGGEFQPNHELSEGHWMLPSDLAGLQTTDGLAEIVTTAYQRLGETG